ncbi:Hypothetical predicted protein [Marmota monax]|uniref:Uncharacterized protein n=1 Tax=Marmota monax TaxID=9995 RepID=A0A5E4BP65_MARMO|nr:Hypothetical predicted protein [Marmota monax]
MSDLRFPLRLSPHPFPASHSWTLNVERKRCRHPASLAERSAADRRLFLDLGVLKYCESNLEEGVAGLPVNPKKGLEGRVP